MRDITVMDNLTPSDLPPQSGWIAALVVTLGGLLKGAWPYLRSRSDAHAKLTKEERDAARAEERDLVLTLKEAVGKHEGKIEQLEKRLDSALQLITILTKEKATLETDLKHTEALLDASERRVVKLEAATEQYRAIIQAAQAALIEAGRPQAASQIGDALSDADEARSLPGVKPPGSKP